MYNKKRKSMKSKVLQGLTLAFTLLFTILGNLCMPFTAYAVGELDDLSGDVDLTSYTFDELCLKGVTFPGSFDALKTGGLESNTGLSSEAVAIQKGMYYNFKSAQEYYKWLDDALKYIKRDGDSNENFGDDVKRSAGSWYKFSPEPKGLDKIDSEQKETEAWARYNTVSNKITRIMARGAGENLVGDVFGQEFDPTNAVTLAAMNTFTMVCNTIFNTIAKALMLLFLVQTGFDVLYLVIPALQPLLAPASGAGTSGGGAGLAKSGNGMKLPFTFNLVSNEAVEANSKGVANSVGGGGNNASGIFQSNIALRYLSARAPLIIIALTYFVLVATNVWADIISATTSLITGIFYGL